MRLASTIRDKLLSSKYSHSRNSDPEINDGYRLEPILHERTDRAAELLAREPGKRSRMAPPRRTPVAERRASGPLPASAADLCAAACACVCALRLQSAPSDPFPSVCALQLRVLVILLPPEKGLAIYQLAQCTLRQEYQLTKESFQQRVLEILGEDAAILHHVTAALIRRQAKAPQRTSREGGAGASRVGWTRCNTRRSGRTWAGGVGKAARTALAAPATALRTTTRPMTHVRRGTRAPDAAGPL